MWHSARVKIGGMIDSASTSWTVNFCAVRIFCWSENLHPPRNTNDLTSSSIARDAEWNSRERVTSAKSPQTNRKYSGQTASTLKSVGTKGRSNEVLTSEYIRFVSSGTSCSSKARVNA